MSIQLVMPSNHLILCCPLLALPSTFPSVRVFSSESALCIRWPKYWSFSFSMSPSNEYSGLISFRIDWFDLLAVQGTLKSLLQHHSSKASILQCSAFLRSLMQANPNRLPEECREVAGLWERQGKWLEGTLITRGERVYVWELGSLMEPENSSESPQGGPLRNGFAWVETRRASALDCGPSPRDPSRPALALKERLSIPLPRKPPHLRETGCYLKVCKRPACFSSWSCSFRTISMQFRAQMEHMVGGPQEREYGILRRRGVA